MVNQRGQTPTLISQLNNEKEEEKKMKRVEKFKKAKTIIHIQSYAPHHCCDIVPGGFGVGRQLVKEVFTLICI